MTINMSDRIPIMDVAEDQPVASATSFHGNSFNYEELMGGNIPCPSCGGAGRIPKELEHQFVALIPLNDKRLKPRRTLLWVILAVICSLLVSGLCIFFLIPRSVSLSSTKPDLTPYYAQVNSTEESASLSFYNYVNITNGNYVPATVVAATLTTVSIYDSRQVGDEVVNSTKIYMSPLGHGTVTFNVSVHFDKDSSAKFCSFVDLIFLQFQFLVTTSYLGHSEDSSLTTLQRVYCSTHPDPDLVNSDMLYSEQRPPS